MEIPYIFNIQKFSVHDGPGIRTTLFFKGCPLRCNWCHNPESQSYAQEFILTKSGKSEAVGKQYTIAQLVKELEKDQIFYEQSGGGVTLSGGEVMTQNMDYIEALAKKLNQVGISVWIDTCGEASYDAFKRIQPYVEGFLYDLKLMDSKAHEHYIGKDNHRILENLKQLSRDNAHIRLRLIQIDGLNSSETSMLEIYKWLQLNQVRIEAINLLPYHEFGRDKYARLNRQNDLFCKPTAEALESAQAFWRLKGYPVAIGG
ncbi:radical SAM protein [Fusibacter sp. Q10-2]|uniref:Radical SAM protein n=2 Tax=Fusibacter ferrireducens TaxID=2785058 RepID=A0ABR9ZZ87_9FIRM|nr:radical SAM protein [Fusibacter ferrireducens]